MESYVRNPVLRRMARRAGVQRVDREVYDETRSVLRERLQLVRPYFSMRTLLDEADYMLFDSFSTILLRMLPAPVGM